jgi:hypothetical protein
MKFSEFEKILSRARMSRYLIACGGNSKKAMTLYRYNLKLSQELLTVISCFEVAFRNSINVRCELRFGSDWLRDGVQPGGIFDSFNCRETKRNIIDAITKLNTNYTHNKLVAELGFGFWRYMFAAHQFTATGRILLSVFPLRPRTTVLMQYNHTFFFNQLENINKLRNRVAHHEPVCFRNSSTIKDTTYARQQYALILQLFQWMEIDENALLYGLDHVIETCLKIDNL